MCNNRTIVVHELTVIEIIWTIIIEVVTVIAEITSVGAEEPILQSIENSKRLDALQIYDQTA